MSAPAIAALNALDPAALAAALSGPRDAVAAFVRAAAEAGSAEAQARHAQMLLDGDGLPADPQGAFAWFTRAAGAGHLEAANMLGRCHELGWGTPIDQARAVAWYRLAAARGLTEAKYNYATALALGRGVAEDRAQALALFHAAAADGFAKAMNFVGSFHEDGWAGPPDLPEAARWYARAAAGGDFRGAFNHARMLAAAGDAAGAATWIARARDWGTPRFRAQLAAHLARRAA